MSLGATCPPHLTRQAQLGSIAAMNSTRRKLAISTWSSPREGNIYGKLSIDATHALAYLEQLRNRSGERVTIGHLVAKAVALALAQTPGLNGRILWGKFVPHRTVDLAFLVALDDGKDLAKAKIERADDKSVIEIARQLRTYAERLRQGKDEAFEKNKGLLRALPTWLLRPLLWLTGWLTSALGIAMLGLEPFPFGSCIITNVGVFGVDEGYAPPTPFARVPLYVLIGAVHEQPAVVDERVVVRPYLTITATIDHRFVDGAQVGGLARCVRRVLEQPWTLDAASEQPSVPASTAASAE